eukprot:3390692-Prymnesium_polylepis.1
MRGLIGSRRVRDTCLAQQAQPRTRRGTTTDTQAGHARRPHIVSDTSTATHAKHADGTHDVSHDPVTRSHPIAPVTPVTPPPSHVPSRAPSHTP